MENSTKKFLRTSLYINLLCIGAMVALSIWAWPQIPAGQQMPVHWGISGTADGYAPKEIGLSMLPVIMLFVVFVFHLTLEAEKQTENLAKSLSVVGVSMYGTMALMLVVHVMLVLGAMGSSMPVPQVIGICIGLLLGSIGALLAAGKSGRNTSVGVRTPWTLKSDESWRKTNQFAGLVMVVMGAGTLVGGALNQMIVLAISVLSGVVILLAGSWAYSYWIWKAEQKP